MPSKTKNQLNYFKLVKSFKDDGIKGFFNKWRELFGTRRFPDREYINKIIDISKKIKSADLEDMASGIEGEEVLGDTREFKVGYWARFKGRYRKPDGKIYENEFIAPIKNVNFSSNIVSFNINDIYNKTGGRILPLNLKRANIIDPQFQYLDYAYFNDVIKTAKTKNELTDKKETPNITMETQNQSSLTKEQLMGIIDEALMGMFGDEKSGDYKGILSEENIVDSQGRKIITGRLVHHVNDKYKSGKVLGLTNELGVRVKWFLPEEIRDTIEIVEPDELIVYA